MNYEMHSEFHDIAPSRTAAKASASATQRAAGVAITAELDVFMPNTPLLPKHGAPLGAVMDGQLCEMIDVRVDASLKHSVHISVHHSGHSQMPFAVPLQDPAIKPP